MILGKNIAKEKSKKIALVQAIINYKFADESLLLAAITHPSASEGMNINCSYERLEFLGDSLLGFVVASGAYKKFPDFDEGKMTRIKVSLVSGDSLSSVSDKLGLSDGIIFGSSEAGTGKRGLQSALENVYEAIVGAIYLDGGIDAAKSFVERTLFDKMNEALAQEPDNPKSELQERLQEDGITPTYKLIETVGPPHDRTFTSRVFAGEEGLGYGTGKSKKESESRAARSTLDHLNETKKQKAGIGAFFASIKEKALGTDHDPPAKGKARAKRAVKTKNRNKKLQ